MAIAHDTSTRFPATENTADTTTGDRSFTHTPTGTPAGVAVVVCCTGTTSSVTGVTYGGTSLTLTTSATDTSEPGRVEVWTLADAAVPTGAQTVVLQGCTASPKYATCSTATSATNYSTVNNSNAVNTTTSTNPQVTVTTTATTMTYGGLHTGNLAPLTVPAAGCTAQNNRDYGALASNTSRRTSAAAAGSIVLGWTFGTSDDWCMAAASLAEASAPPPPSGLILHSSSPGIVWNAGTATNTTASFTPPANSRLAILWSANSGAGNAPAAPTITDSLGVPLTYTLEQHSKSPEVPNADGQAAIWTAAVTASTAMTITTTNNDPATGQALKVQVWTHDSGSTPTIGSTDTEGSSTTSTTSVSQSFTATANDSRGLMAVCDWDATSPAPAAGTGCTLTGGGSASQSPTLTYAFALRSSADGVSGSLTTLNVTLGAASANKRWAVVEIVPPVVVATGLPSLVMAPRVVA